MRAAFEDDPLEISSKWLLLVEGKDEKLLLRRLIRSRIEGDDIRRDIQIVAAGGKDAFRRRLGAIAVEIRRKRRTEAIGIIRDADDNSAGAFQSVANDVTAVGYQPPRRHGKYSDGDPSIGIFIAPDGSGPGAIETLIRRSVQDGPTSGCVKRYLQCLEKGEVLWSRNQDKSFVHAYLAAQRDPMVRVGEAAQKGVWDFGSSAFVPLSQFVHDLISKNSSA